MIFQIAVLRELRFQLSTIFTLTPFLFSSVVVFIGLGSLAAGRLRSGSRTILRWSAVILPAVLLPLFALMILVAQGTIDHASEGFAYGTPRPGAGDAYIRAVVQGSIAVALFGYGAVFFLQGLIFALYFREGRREGILSNVYAVDLIASGFGALAGGLLTFVMSPTRMVMVASTLLLANTLVLARHLQPRRWLVAAATIATLGLIVGDVATGTLDRLEEPRWLGEPLAYSQWSRYCRIDVVDRPQELRVFADGLLFQGDRKGDTSHARNQRALPAGSRRRSLVSRTS